MKLNLIIKGVFLFITAVIFSNNSIGAARYWIATTTSNWNNTANWSTSSGGSGGASVPGVSDDVYFNSARNGNCTIDATISVNGWDIGGYTGAITNTSYAITVSANNYFTQSSGTFNGGSGNITVNARLSISGGTFNCGSGTVDINGTGFYLTGGTFTSTSGTLYLSHAWNHTTGGTFSHNSGTVVFDGTGNHAIYMIGNSETFYNLTVNRTSGGTINLYASTDKAIITGTLTLNQGNVGSWNSYAVTLEAQGNVTVASGFGTISTYVTLNFTGTANQNFDLTGATNKVDGNIGINKASGTVTLLSGLTMDGGGDLNLISGTLNLNGQTLSNTVDLTYCTGTFTISGTGTLGNYGWSQTSGSPALTISGASTFTIGTGHFVMSSGTFNAGSATLDFNGNFNFTGGTFTNTSGTMNLSRDWIHATSGTFNHNNGTLILDGNFTSPPGKIQMVGNSETFNNVTFSLVAGSQCIYTANDNIIVLGTLTLTTGSVSPWNGGNAVSIETKGEVVVASSFGTLSSDVTLKMTGTSQSLTMTGAESKILGNFSFGSTTNLNLASNITVASGKTITVTSTGSLNMNNYIIGGAGSFATSSGSKLRIGSTAGITTSGLTGNIQVSGSRTYNTGCDYYYNGSDGAQVTGNGLPATVGIFSAGNSSGVTLQSNLSVSSSLQISGILDIGSYTVNRVSAGGSMTINAGATLKIGGSNSLPSNYSTHSIDATSTVEYYGSSQTIAGLNSSQSYGNLTINSSGANTTNSFSISGILTVGSGKSLTAYNGTITFNNGASIVNSGGTLNFLNLTLTSGASVTSNGSFTVATTFSLGSGATFTPAANDIISGASATLTGNGTVKVTRTSATADFNSQYTLTTKTLTNLTVDYAGASAQVISALTYYYLKMSNSAGASMSGNTTINSTLTLTTGNISLGSYDLIMASGSSISGGSNSSFIYTGSTGSLKYNSCAASSTKTFPVGHTNSSAGYVPLVLTFNGGHTTDDFSVIAVDKVTNDGTRNGTAYTSTVVKAMWYIIETNSGGSNVTMQFQWNATDEAAGFVRSSCYMSHFTNSAWEKPGADGSASGSNPYTFTYSNYTGSFSPFGMGGSGGPLPVDLLFFRAEAENETAQLKWATASEINNDYFEIQKSLDGKNFETIGKIIGAGNSQQIVKYSYIDSNLSSGINYYRLKQKDYNGEVSYSKIEVVSNQKLNSHKIKLRLYPVPASDFINIELNNIGELETLIRVIDMTGNTISEKIITLTKGYNIIEMAIRDIPDGVYFIQIPGVANYQSTRFLIDN